MPRIDQEIERGDDWDFPFNFKDGANVAIDITGWTIFFTIKSAIDDAADDSAAVLTKDQTSHTNAALGLTTISIEDIDTKDLNAVEYWYDFQYKDSSGKIKTIMRGIMIIAKDVTRRTS